MAVPAWHTRVNHSALTQAVPPLNARVVSLVSALDLGICTLALPGFLGGRGGQSSQ